MLICPYNNDSSATAKTLGQRGFEVIRTECNPEPQ
jgi:hypothetical protein